MFSIQPGWSMVHFYFVVKYATIIILLGITCNQYESNLSPRCLFYPATILIQGGGYCLLDPSRPPSATCPFYQIILHLFSELQIHFVLFMQPYGWISVCLCHKVQLKVFWFPVLTFQKIKWKVSFYNSDKERSCRYSEWNWVDTTIFILVQKFLR